MPDLGTSTASLDHYRVPYHLHYCCTHLCYAVPRAPLLFCMLGDSIAISKYKADDCCRNECHFEPIRQSACFDNKFAPTSAAVSLHCCTADTFSHCCTGGTISPCCVACDICRGKRCCCDYALVQPTAVYLYMHSSKLLLELALVLPRVRVTLVCEHFAVWMCL